MTVIKWHILFCLFLTSAGQLGHGDMNRQYEPKVIEALVGMYIQKVVCGCQFSLALTSIGQVRISLSRVDVHYLPQVLLKFMLGLLQMLLLIKLLNHFKKIQNVLLHNYLCIIWHLITDLFLCWDVIKHHSLIYLCISFKGIPPGRSIKIILVQPVLHNWLWHVLSCLWNGAYKWSLATNRKV